MLIKLLSLAGCLLAATIAAYATYEMFRSGKAPLSPSGDVHVERDKNPLGWQVKVIIGCLMSAVFIAVSIRAFIDLFK